MAWQVSLHHEVEAWYLHYWDGWYREAIPLADERFTRHLREMEAQERKKR
jgi:hypothetical protein